MPSFIQRLAAAGLVVVGLAALAGCSSNDKTAAPPQATAAPQSDSGPGEIELSEAKATLDEGKVVQFQVNYRFTKGRPDKYYAVDITFPGTPNHGNRAMFSWELKDQGVIKDGIVLTNPPVKSFEIRMSEATSPQNGYKVISNVVRGEVE